jgi:hypothetical protein
LVPGTPYRNSFHGIGFAFRKGVTLRPAAGSGRAVRTLTIRAMSGRYVELDPGRYTLAVSRGDGPAGVHRSKGDDVVVGVAGGRADFHVDREGESVFYWWRGPEERPGVRLLGVTQGDPRPDAEPGGKEEPWPTRTAG